MELLKKNPEDVEMSRAQIMEIFRDFGDILSVDLSNVIPRDDG